MPAEKLQRLHDADPGESCPEFSNAWARFAQVAFEAVDGVPTRVIDTLYYKLKFTATGMLDRQALDDYARLGVQSIAIGIAQGLDARPLLAKKKMIDRYHWKPTPAQARAIREAALTPPRTRRGLRLLSRQ